MVKALVIVAHPDDETLWMGSYILDNKMWEWHILSLCRADDIDRAPKFRKVCALLGAQCNIADLEDENLQPLALTIVIQKIKELLPSQNFDYIFTHGENGEYGHIRHKEIYQAVNKMIQAKELSCKSVFYFSYNIAEKQYEKGNKTNLIFSIPSNLQKMKKHLIHDVYGFKEGVFESNLCNIPEESFFMREIL